MCLKEVADFAVTVRQFQNILKICTVRSRRRSLKRGDDHILHVAFETISDKYAPNGEKLCDSVIELMLSIMFESTSFSDEIVEQEKKNAKDRIMAMMKR